ncbi:protein Bouncer-like [Stigmatopora nigra]
MAAQGTHSLEVSFILMAVVLLLPACSQPGPFRCHFCPLQPKEDPCFNITTECPPNYRCATSRGYYGAFHALSHQGCVERQLCDGAPRAVYYMGVEYKVKRECCCRDECNMAPGSEGVLKMLLDIMAEKDEYAEATRLLRKRLLGSCEDDPTIPSPSVSMP